MSQLKSLSRLSLKPKRRASKRSATAGSRTRRDSATDDDDEEALTRQSSRSSISGRSSITSDRGRFYKLRPLERAGSSTRTVYHAPVFDSQVGLEDSQVDLEDLNSSAGHTPFAATPSRMSISMTTPPQSSHAPWPRWPGVSSCIAAPSTNFSRLPAAAARRAPTQCPA